MAAKKLPEDAIFPKGTKIAGEQIANEHFIGTAWLGMLVKDDSTFHCPIGNVTFEPRCTKQLAQTSRRADPVSHERQRIFPGRG